MDTTAINTIHNLPNRVRQVSIPQQEQGFANLLKQVVKSVSDIQQEADKAARDFVTGDAENIHDTMLALEKGDLSLRLLNQTKNKIVEAYQEIMRMQV